MLIINDHYNDERRHLFIPKYVLQTFIYIELTIIKKVGIKFKR